MRYLPILSALALAACGSDKAEAPAPDNTTVVEVPADEAPCTPRRENTREAHMPTVSDEAASC